jgi:hypothetical protein
MTSVYAVLVLAAIAFVMFRAAQCCDSVAALQRWMLLFQTAFAYAPTYLETKQKYNVLSS